MLMPRGKIYIDGYYAAVGPPSQPAQSQQARVQVNYEGSEYYYPSYYSDWHQLAVKAGKAQKPKPKPNTLVENVAEEHGAMQANINIKMGGSTRVPEAMLSESSANSSKPANTLTSVQDYDGPWIHARKESVWDKLKENADKIPGVSFYYMLDKQMNLARQENLMIAARDNSRAEALALGFSMGVLEGTVGMPVAMYHMGEKAVGVIKEAGKQAASVPLSGKLGLGLSSVKEERDESIPSRFGALSADIDFDVGGHTEVNSKTLHPTGEVTTLRDDEAENFLMAGVAPGTYRNIEQLKKEGSELVAKKRALEEQKAELMQDESYLENLRVKIENEKSPEKKWALARLYNTEATLYNSQVNDFNMRVLQYNSEVNEYKQKAEPVKEFYGRMKSLGKWMSAGELAGSALAGFGMFAGLSEDVMYLAPERTVIKTTNPRPEIKNGGIVYRTTMKRTLEKGWREKRPLESEHTVMLLKNKPEPDVLISPEDVLQQWTVRTVHGENAALSYYEVGGNVLKVDKYYSFREVNPTLDKGFLTKAKEFFGDILPRKGESEPVNPVDFEGVTGKPYPSSNFIKTSRAAVENGEVAPSTLLAPKGEVLISARPSTILAKLEQRFRPDFTLKEYGSAKVYVKNRGTVLVAESSPKGTMTGVHDLGLLNKDFTPEDLKIIFKHTRAATNVLDAGKWEKVSLSTNVGQYVYDPLLEAQETRAVTSTAQWPLNGKKVNYAFTPEVRANGMVLLATPTAIPDVFEEKVNQMNTVKAEPLVQQRVRSKNAVATVPELTTGKEGTSLIFKKRLQVYEQWLFKPKENVVPVDITGQKTTVTQEEDTTLDFTGGVNLNFEGTRQVLRSVPVENVKFATLNFMAVSTPPIMPVAPTILHGRRHHPFRKKFSLGGAGGFGPWEWYTYTGWVRRFKGLDFDVNAFEKGLASLDNALRGFKL